MEGPSPLSLQFNNHPTLLRSLARYLLELGTNLAGIIFTQIYSIMIKVQ